MINIPIPPVPDLARAQGQTVEEVVEWFRNDYYTGPSVNGNYLTGTRCAKASYRGLHNLPQLLAACDKEKQKQGKRSNSEVVELAAPVAFGRSTQVFDLPRRQFAFGRDLYANYRIPFFFVENGIVKLYYLQPRKGSNLTFDELSMVATIYKRYLLDTEFFGQTSDVEFVDVSANGGKHRSLHIFSLKDLELWPEKKLSDRLTLISAALDFIRENNLVEPRRRIVRQPPSDLPLF